VRKENAISSEKHSAFETIRSVSRFNSGCGGVQWDYRSDRLPDFLTRFVRVFLVPALDAPGGRVVIGGPGELLNCME
jgi:hypothetical protein